MFPFLFPILIGVVDNIY